MKTRKILSTFVFLVLISIPISVLGQYDVPHYVVSSGGGGQSTDGSVYVSGTVSQTTIGISTVPANQVKSGYWYVLDALHIGPTSEVTFAAVGARLSDEGVVLHWEIADASDLQGFYVYRSTQEGADFARLNESLLPATKKTYIDDTAKPGNVYWYAIGAIDQDGESISLSVKIEIPLRETTLYQNFPNPFNPETTIAFYLPEVELVTITIYDSRGKRVRQLVNDKLEHGKHQIPWNGHNDQNEAVGSGLYFYKMTAGKKSFIKKMVLLK